MALTRETMTDEQRKSVVLDYLKATQAAHRTLPLAGGPLLSPRPSNGAAFGQ
jgi:hypothetical protein